MVGESFTGCGGAFKNSKSERVENQALFFISARISLVFNALETRTVTQTQNRREITITTRPRVKNRAIVDNCLFNRENKEEKAAAT